MTEIFDYDYVVIGSGFGGSVSALRLAEKGYSVAVLESGKRFRGKDFPKTNWNVRKYLYAPRFGCHGILRLDLFKGLFVLSGAGVGGGSLGYANTLIEPPEDLFAKATWPHDVGVKDWRMELKRFYQIAKDMLGATEAPTNFEADEIIRKTAQNLGIEKNIFDMGIMGALLEKAVNHVKSLKSTANIE